MYVLVFFRNKIKDAIIWNDEEDSGFNMNGSFVNMKLEYAKGAFWS